MSYLPITIFARFSTINSRSTYGRICQEPRNRGRSGHNSIDLASLVAQKCTIFLSKSPKSAHKRSIGFCSLKKRQTKKKCIFREFEPNKVKLHINFVFKFLLCTNPYEKIVGIKFI